MQAVVTCEVIYLGELLRVVDEVLHSLTVFGGEVVLHCLETLEYTLADCHAWYDDDELAPSVELVEFIHGLDVGVGLAGTGLHLDCEVDTASLKLLNRFEALAHLDCADVVGDGTIVEHQRGVAEALNVEETRRFAGIHDVLGAVGVLLSEEGVGNAFGGFSLEPLMFEFQFHNSRLYYTDVLDCFVFTPVEFLLEEFEDVDFGFVFGEAAVAEEDAERHFGCHC